MRSPRSIEMGQSPLLHSATGRDIMRSARAPERACSATLHRPGRPPGGAVAPGLHMGRTIHPPSEYRFPMIQRFRPPWAALLCAPPRSPADTSPKHDQRANHLEHQPFGKTEPISSRNTTDLDAEYDRSRQNRQNPRKLRACGPPGRRPPRRGRRRSPCHSSRRAPPRGGRPTADRNPGSAPPGTCGAGR